MNCDDLPRAMLSVASHRTVEGVLRALVDTLSAQPSVALVRIWLHDPGEASPRVLAHHPACEGGTFAMPSADVDPAALLSDLPRWPDAGFVDRERVKTLTVHALGDHTSSVGLLAVLDRDEASSADRERLRTFAEHAAVCLGHARAFEQMALVQSRYAEENQGLREEFRDLFDEAPIPYIHEGIDSRFIRVNQAALRVLGLAPEDVTRTFGKTLVADTEVAQHRLSHALSQLGRGSETRGMVIEMRRQDNGLPVWVEWSSRPAAGGQYTRTMLVDITERVLMEQTRSALEFSLESGQIGEWDLDLVRQTSRRSLRHDQCFGYAQPIPEDQWGVEEFLRHVHPEDRGPLQAGMQSAIEARADWAADFRVIWPDDSLHWLVARGRVYRAENGKATRMLGIVTDITDRKKNEEILRATKAALEFALESAQVGDWDLDLVNDTSRRSLRHDRCFGYMAPIAEEAWGIDAFVRHVHPADRARVEAGLRRAARGLGDFDAEFRVVWPDMSEHWLIARGSVFRANDGSASRMLGVVMDVTDRKRAEEALSASDRFARGQVEALTRTLDALAAESAPDRLAEHVLRTIATQLGAQSCSVWRRDEESGLFDFQCSLESGKFFQRSDVGQSGVTLRISMHEFWPDESDLMAARPAVMEDISVLEDAAWRARLMALGVVSVLMVPMSIGGHVDGTIGIRFTRRREFLNAEIDLAKALANQTMLALQLTRLSAQAQESAVIAERNRMARDIHDTLAQGFTGVIVQLEAAADAASRGLSNDSAGHVTRAKDLARESLTEARRSVRALRPQELDNKQLSEALEVLVRKMTAGTAVVAEFTLLGRPQTLPVEWDENLLRIVQEGLTNALRHARASRFSLRMAFEPNRVELHLHDDGRGFDPAHKSDGFGLLGIGERVAGMGGSLQLATAPGTGVSLSITLPLVADRQSTRS